MVIKKFLLGIFLYFITFQFSYSMTLSDTLKKTIETNPSILITVKDRSAIDEALQQARAAYLPKVKTNVGFGLDQNRNSSTIGTANPFPVMPKRELGILATQMIFDGFATQSDVARNMARVNSATYKAITTIQDTLQRDVEVYLGVLREEELVLLAKQNLFFHEKITRMIQMRVEHGISRLADLYQARGRLALARVNLLAEYSNLADARANFFRTIGIVPHRLSLPARPDRRFLPDSQAEAIEIALKNNPTINSSEEDIIAAIQQHNFSKSTNFPRIELHVGGNRDRNVGGVRGASFEQFAMMRMTYDLYNGGADISKQRETAFQTEAAKETRDQAIDQLIEAVRLTWNSLITAKARLPWLKAHQTNSIETVGAYAKQFQIGQRTLLDLLDSQNESFASKRSYVSGKYDLLLAEYRILRDMGISIAAFNIHCYLPDSSYAAAAAPVNVQVHKKIIKQFGSPYDALDQLHREPKTRIPATDPLLNKKIKPPQLQEWAVQMGSFKKSENALNLAEKLRKVGYTVFIDKIQRHQDILSRVCVGPQNNYNLARKLQKHLHGILIVKNHITSEIIS